MWGFLPTSVCETVATVINLPAIRNSCPSMKKQKGRSQALLKDRACESEMLTLQRKWITTSEIISVFLIPSPYVLISLFSHRENTMQIDQSATSQLLKAVTEVSPIPKAKLSNFEPGILSTCAITSVALLLMGFGGRYLNTTEPRDRRKGSTTGDVEKQELNRINLSTARICLGRILSVALPFYAAAKLGTNRVGLIMLMALATGLMPIDDKGTDLTKSKNFKRFLLSQRWSIASILLQIGCDVVGLTYRSALSSAWMGYIALGASILVLPPPFPSSKPKTSAVTSANPQSRSAGSAVLAKPEALKPTDIILSPLVCTGEDTNLTLIAGGLLAILSIIILSISKTSAGALQSTSLALMFLSACVTALSYTIAQPQSIRHSKGLGLISGALLCALLSFELHHDSWISFAYQGIFISISFAATKQDTQSLFSKSSHSRNNDHNDHQNHHNLDHPNGAHHDHPSRFSEALLRLFQQWPLLHSILAEKDSRRIFYFMRF